MDAHPATSAADLAKEVRRIHVTAAVAAAVWLLLVAASTIVISNRVMASSMTVAAEAAKHENEEIADVIDRMFHELATVPQVLATDRELLAIAARYSGGGKAWEALQRLTPDARNQQLRNDAEVSRVGQRLTAIRNDLRYDLLFVVNDRGTMIVRSDWDRPTNLLGMQLDDRDFYRDAMAGRPVQTFAVGRVTQNPVLVFAVPMQSGGHPIGVTVVRESAADIGAALAGDRHVAMIVDGDGVIVATSRPDLLLQHAGALADRQPDPSTLRERYGKEALQTLGVTRPARGRHANEWMLNGSAYLLGRLPLTIPSYQLLVLSRIDERIEAGALHYAISVVVALFGLLLLLIANRRAEGRAQQRHNQRTTTELNAKLTALNQDKDRYLGIAAHDLRNPLSSMRGLAEMMIQAPIEPDQQREFLETIRRTSDEMLGLVNDLLDVAVIESGKLELRRSELDISKLVRQRVRLLEPYARSKTIEIRVDAVDGLRASVDRARFGQVADNLVSNAIKFSPAGTTVTVALRADDGLTLVVEDQGPGIPEEDMKVMFRSFQKLSARPTAGEKSTGLGLAIVKRIVDAHGGRIDVANAPGSGARFTVRLPAAIEGAPGHERQAEYSSAAR